MVLAISFLEAPLKFRAPGITRQLGVGIGRIVFAALNKVEVGLSALLAIAACRHYLAAADRPLGIMVAAALPIAILAIQLLAIRPRLRRQSDDLVSGKRAGSQSRSQLHLAYVGCEVVKVLSLIGAVSVFAAAR